jgi:hypothetical protein
MQSNRVGIKSCRSAGNLSSMFPRCLSRYGKAGVCGSWLPHAAITVSDCSSGKTPETSGKISPNMVPAQRLDCARISNLMICVLNSDIVVHRAEIIDLSAELQTGPIVTLTGLVSARWSRERIKPLPSGMNCDGPSLMVDQSDGVEWMRDAKMRHVSVIGPGLH